MLLLSKSTIIGHVCGQLSAPSRQYFIVMSMQVIRTVCDEQLLPSIQNTLSDGVTLNMGEVNDVYLLILKRYHVELDETTNYRKHLKQLNTEYLPNAQFVKSFR